MNIREMAATIEKVKQMRRALKDRPIRYGKRRRDGSRSVRLDVLSLDAHLALGDVTEQELRSAERLLPGVVAMLKARQGSACSSELRSTPS